MNQNLLNILFIIGEASLFYGLERLHNSIFLIQKQNKNIFNYNFIRANYGPFSLEINQDLNFLLQNKLISSDYSSATYEKTYRLTILGYQLYHEQKTNKSLFDKNDFELLQKMLNYSKNEYRNFIYQTQKVSDYELGDKMS